MSGVRTATSLLTRIPVRDAPPDSPALSRSLPWFPVVGAIVGLAVAGVYATTRLALPPTVAAALGLVTGVVLTGALHEDGLADTADALLGGWTPQDRLRIIKDPAHGTYGVLAIAFIVVLRVTAIASMGAWAALAIIPSAYSMSRAGSAVLFVIAPPAVDSGLGASYARAVQRRHVAGSIVVALTMATGALGIWAAAAAGITMLTVWLLGRLALRRMGGITGDVLGAAEQAAEVALLLLGVALVRHHWLTVPLWR